MPDYGKYRRLPFDPRMAQEIKGRPELMAEQGAGFLSSWGGPSGYQTMAKMPPTQRVVYRAVEDGITTSGEISQATGLTNTEVESALSSLNKKGLVNLEPAEPEAM